MSWKFTHSGKVRDIYENDELNLVALVATDRVSAFDKVLPGDGIPGKGIALTAISNYWAVTTSDIPNAYIWDLNIIEPFCKEFGIDQDRVTIQRRTRQLPIEAIVRGYITGSAWRDYEAGSRMICGEYLPDGLEESARLPKAYFTPTTKGEHDENITFDQMKELLQQTGFEPYLAELVRKTSIKLYHRIYDIAAGKGFILADVKFEFGLDERTGQLLVTDEIATSDSSRYWAQASYKSGVAQDSYDKEIVRRNIRDKKKAGIENPTVDPQIIEITAERYKQLARILVGKSI